MAESIDLSTGVKSPWRASATKKEIMESPKKGNFIYSNGRTLENISAVLYGNEKYWSIIAEYNQIVNPLNVPEKVFHLTFDQISRAING